MEGQWATRSLLVGKDKVISRRVNPTRWQHLISPLGAAGNLYGGGRRCASSRSRLGATRGSRQIGVVETFEDWPLTSPSSRRRSH